MGGGYQGARLRLQQEPLYSERLHHQRVGPGPPRNWQLTHSLITCPSFAQLSHSLVTCPSCAHLSHSLITCPSFAQLTHHVIQLPDVNGSLFSYSSNRAILMHSLTHPLTHLSTRSFAQSHTNTLTHPPTSLTYPLTRSSTTHPLVQITNYSRCY